MKTKTETELWRKSFPFRVIFLFVTGFILTFLLFVSLSENFQNLPKWLSDALILGSGMQIFGFLYVLKDIALDMIANFVPEGRLKLIFFKDTKQQNSFTDQFYRSGYKDTLTILFGAPILSVVIMFSGLKIAKVIKYMPSFHIVDSLKEFFTI